MDIEFSGQYDQKTFFRAIALAGRPAGWLGILRLGLSILIFGTLIVMAVMWAMGRIDNPARLLRSGIAAFLAACYLIFPYISSPRVAAQLWKSPAMRARLDGRVTPFGIEVGDRAEAVVKWGDIARVQKTDEFVTFVVAGGGILILPKCFFENEGDWKRFLQMVADRVRLVK